MCYSLGWQKKRKSAQKKQKCGCADDDPPEPLEEVQNQYDCMLELQRHLLCQEHSEGGMRTYCHVEQQTGQLEGKHHEIDNKDLTLWAKHIMSEKISVNNEQNSP